MNIPYLRKDEPFPPATSATEQGIVAYGGDLSPGRLLDAYRAGIFPWYNADDPILWWSPDPRCLLFVKDFYVNKTLSKRIRNGGFEVKFDHDFKKTINLCREVENRVKEGTWLIPEMIEAYENLHALGYAHSIETYLNGELVGGLYGVSLGKAFFGESMFSTIKDASKVALAALVEFCKTKDFHFIDSQILTDHMKQMGAVCINRSQYLNHLNNALQAETYSGSWKNFYPIES